jgi:hypothetical protein
VHLQGDFAAIWWYQNLFLATVFEPSAMARTTRSCDTTTQNQSGEFGSAAFGESNVLIKRNYVSCSEIAFSQIIDAEW